MKMWDNCKLCEFVTHMKNKLDEHIDNLHTAHDYKCTDCDFVALAAEEIKIHKWAAHQKVFTCDECSFITTESTSSAVHRTSQYTYPCLLIP